MSPLLAPSDASLVRKALSGNSRSVEALVLRYHRKACAVARAITLDPDAAEDVVQEALLLALQNLPKLRVHASFGPWFLQIVRNAAKRSLRREPVRFEADPVDPTVEALDPVEVREFRERIWSEVSELPTNLREAVFLYYHEGRSVAAVAQTLGTSTAAAKKRLQVAREHLRGKLWRSLEESLLHLLPSAKEWRAKGRRLALVTLAALPATRTLSAATVAGSASSVSALTSTSTFITTIGGIIMANKILIGTATAVAVIAGTAFVFNQDGDEPSNGDASRPDLGAAREPEVGADLEADLEASKDEARRLREENRRLAIAVEEAKNRATRQPSIAETEPKATAVSETGLDWSNFASLVKENTGLIAKATAPDAGQPSPEDQAILMQLMTELMKIGSQAKRQNPQPFFDPVFFDEFSHALFDGSLELSSEQVASLSQINEEIFADVIGDVDVSTLGPIERYALRMDVSDQSLSALEEMLGEDQVERWVPLSEFAAAIFEGPVSTREHGLDLPNLKSEIVDDWKESFGLEPHQIGHVEDLAKDYASESREILERVAENEEAARQLSPEAKKSLERDFFDLQRRYETQIIPLLDATQLEKYRKGTPVLLRFRHGRGGGMSDKGSYF